MGQLRIHHRAANSLLLRFMLLITPLSPPYTAKAAQAILTFAPLPLVSETSVHQRFGSFSTDLKDVAKSPVKQSAYELMLQTRITGIN